MSDATNQGPEEFVGTPGNAATDWLWKALVIGLIGLVVLGYVLAFILNAFVPGAEPGPFVTLGTAALTGLLGLFVTPAKA